MSTGCDQAVAAAHVRFAPKATVADQKCDPLLCVMSGYAPIVIRSSVCWRVFRVLRQVIGDLEPRRLAADEDVACWPHRWIIENGERDAILS
jgi:hypothetical protein